MKPRVLWSLALLLSLLAANLAYSQTPAVSLSTNSLSFGSQPLESESASLSVTLTNTGTGDAKLIITSMVITNGDFTFSPTSTCKPNTPIAVKAPCVINVTFTPKAIGIRLGGLIITDNDGGVATSQQVVALMGTGVAAKAPQTGTVQSPPTTGLAGNQGIPLKTDLTVKGNITAQAVLIPYDVGRRVFGREIAKNYAIIQLTINNKSPDAALIIQGAFIDYHEWALAGLANPQPNAMNQTTCANGTPQQVIANPIQSSNQACTVPSQVASVEARVARGQLLDDQPYTPRNLFVNGLSLLGSLASAYAFSIKQIGYVKGISAFNGTVVPGVGVFLPDGTVGQLNRISDFGYQTNKVIGKQGSDIIVCFFPIDRFLTPGFKKIFLYEPALLLSPYQLLLDKKSREKIDDPRLGHFSVDPKDILSDLGIDTEEKRKSLSSALPCFLALFSAPSVVSPNPQADSTKGGDGHNTDYVPSQLEEILQSYANSCNPIAGNPQGTGGTTTKTKAQETGGQQKPSTKPTIEQLAQLVTIGKVSLNSIRVVVDGIMTVEVGSVPAKIASVEFDNEKTDATLWTDTSKTLTGTIKGDFLTGGEPVIQSPSNLKPVLVKDGSTDQALKFSLKLPSAIKNATQLTFVVEKQLTDAAGKITKIDSTPFTYAVNYAASTSPQIGSITFDGDQTVSTLWTAAKGTLKGQIRGQNLLAGDTSISIKEAKDLGIPDFKPDATSAELVLTFSFQLSKAINDGQTLTFTVQTKPKDANGTETTATSPAYVYTVHYVPNITHVAVDHDKDYPPIWKSTAAPITGTITGTNLKDCAPAIADAETLGVTVKSDTAKSNDTTLVFSLQLKIAIPDKTKLTFTAVKPIKDANLKETSLSSNHGDYDVTYTKAKPAAPGQPAKPASAAGKVTSPAGGNKP